MAYRITVNGCVIECETLAELVRLLEVVAKDRKPKRKRRKPRP